MKKIIPAFAVATSLIGLIAYGQPQEFFSQSFAQAPANPCVKADNALGKIVLAQEKFSKLEKGWHHFTRAYEVDVTAHEINNLLHQSCADVAVLDKTGKATEEEMKSRMSTAMTRTKAELLEIRIKHMDATAQRLPVMQARTLAPL